MQITFVKEFIKQINYLSLEKWQINTLKGPKKGRNECLKVVTMDPQVLLQEANPSKKSFVPHYTAKLALSMRSLCLILHLID